MRIVIIGGMTAGTTAAQMARLYDRKGEHEIIVLEKEKYPLYSRCALPFVISGKASKERAIEFDKKWYEKHDIELKLSTEVTSLNVKERFVAISSGERIKFDRLIIATGSMDRPRYENCQRIFNLRTLDDAMKIKEISKKAKSAIVMGAGAIGCEVAEALKELSLDVTLIEYFDYVLPKFIDKEIGNRVTKFLEDHGIKLMLGTAVKNVKEEEDRVTVETSKGTLEADFAISALGIKPNLEIIQNQGIELGDTGRIKINERAETNIPGIYAAGECTEYPDLITRKPLPVGLGSIAFRQGMVAGINAAGGNTKLPPGVLNTRVSKIFDIEIAGVGPTANELKNAGIKFKQVISQTKDLPEYYPGGKEYVSKLIFDNEGRILGYQAIGRNAGFRANIIASIILTKGSVFDLEMLETAYTPPTAPILDPIVVPALSASRILRKP